MREKCPVSATRCRKIERGKVGDGEHDGGNDADAREEEGFVELGPSDKHDRVHYADRCKYESCSDNRVGIAEGVKDGDGKDSQEERSKTCGNAETGKGARCTCVGTDVLSKCLFDA